MPFLDLLDLMGVGDRNAFEQECAFCGATIKASHEDNCSFYHDSNKANEKGDNCDCEGTTYVFLLGGRIPVYDCPNNCGEKIMRIIETLLPQIAEKYPAFLRNKAKFLEKTADGLDEVAKNLPEKEG